MAARAFLEENFDPAHPGIADANARLEAAKRRKFPAIRKALPWILAILALATVIASNASTFFFVKTVYSFDLFEPWKKPALPAGLGEEERLLLGDPEVEDLEQKRRLHLHAPENPAYFAEYAQAYLSANETLPPDFQETAARIAPDNAFFLYFAAGQTGKESYTKNRRSGPSPPPRIVDGVRLSSLTREMEYTIADPAAFEEALALVGKAAASPGFETFTNPMTAARVRLLPVDNLAEFGRSLIYAYGTTAAGIIHLRHLADLMSARAEQLSKSNRKEDFIALAKQRDALVSHLGRNPDTFLVGELVNAVIAFGTAKNFEAAADRLGLEELAETYRKQSEAFQQERDMRDIRYKTEDDPLPEDKASTLHRLALPMVSRQVTDPPPIRMADFEPMRMAEHELLAGLGVLSIGLLIPVCALGVFLFRFVATPMIRRPAKRMAGVLRISDWLWVSGLGVAMPILFFLSVTRSTPLSGREFGAPLPSHVSRRPSRRAPACVVDRPGHRRPLAVGQTPRSFPSFRPLHHTGFHRSSRRVGSRVARSPTRDRAVRDGEIHAHRLGRPASVLPMSDIGQRPPRSPRQTRRSLGPGIDRFCRPACLRARGPRPLRSHAHLFRRGKTLACQGGPPPHRS